MPADALPQPWPTPLPGLIHLERVYQDVIGRPLTGAVRITGQARAVHGETVVAPTVVVVKLAEGGRLVADLPAGTYQLDGSFHTADGYPTKETETVSLGS